MGQAQDKGTHFEHGLSWQQVKEKAKKKNKYLMVDCFTWTVFENCKNRDCVASAMTWSKRSVDDTQEKNLMFLDTYANLLYILGKKDEAIAMQQKGVNLVRADKKGEYQAALDKMKKAE